MNIILLNQVDCIVNDLVKELRDVDIQNDQMRFTKNIETLGMILGYEASKYIDYQDIEIKTPYHSCKTKVLASSPVLYTILRAGIAIQHGVQEIFRNSNCAFIAAKHIHSGNPLLQYIDSPTIEKKDLILSDPMIASGKTISFAIDSIKKFGNPAKIIILSVISTSAAIDYLSKVLPNDVVFITCQIDSFREGIRGTNPGLGDVGDLLFGSKIKMNY